MAGERRGHPARPAAVGAALLALLVVVALASRGHHGLGSGGAEGGRPSSGLFDYLFSSALALFVVAAVVALFASAVAGRDRRRQGTRRSGVLPAVVAAAILIALAVAGARFAHLGIGSHHSTRGSRVSTAHAQPQQPRHLRHRAPYRPRFRWLPALVVGAIVLAALGSVLALLARRHFSQHAEEESAAAALALAVDESLDDLRLEPDARRAIVAAYARMERTLAACGLPREPFEAPLEYLGRVLVDLQASAFSVRRLTDLFERAKFSRQELGLQARDQAIEALVTIRGELGGAS